MTGTDEPRESDELKLDRERDKQFDERTELKRQAFQRVAPPRLAKALNAMRLLGQCANLDTYAYTHEDKQELFDAILKGTNHLSRLFDNYRAEKRRETYEALKKEFGTSDQ